MWILLNAQHCLVVKKQKVGMTMVMSPGDQGGIISSLTGFGGRSFYLLV